jgi:hypothetical protein
MIKHCIFWFISLYSISYGFAQYTVYVDWDNSYGSTQMDHGYDMIKALNGGYLLAGITDSEAGDDISEESNGGYDFWVIKINNNGDKEWDARYGGSGYEYLSKVKQTADGGYILGGSSQSDISGDKTEYNRGGDDFWLVRIDSNGNKLWDATFGGSANDILYGIELTSDGGYLIGGSSFSEISGDKTVSNWGYSDYWILKIDSAGNKIWDNTIGSYDSDLLRDIVLCADGNFLLAGFSYSDVGGDKTSPSWSSPLYPDFWLVKIDEEANVIWDKDYGTTFIDNYGETILTNDGGFLLSGYTEKGIDGDKSTNSQGGYDYWIIKLDSSGNKIWDKSYGGTDGDWLSAVINTYEGGYILGGYSYSGIGGDKTYANNSPMECDYWTVKIDSLGNKIWDLGAGGNSSDFMYAIAYNEDGSVLMSGTTASTMSGDVSEELLWPFNYWSIKINPCEPEFVRQPIHTVGCESRDVYISAEALASDVQYNWIKDSVWLGADSSVLVIENVSYSDTGFYYCIAYSECDSTISDTAYLSVSSVPSSTITPLGDLNICETNSVDLMALEEGDTLTHQWLFNNELISAATDQIYTATAIGDYAVITTNAANCADTSEYITVIDTCAPTVSIYNLASGEISVFPNPASDVIYMQTNIISSNDLIIELTDITGKITAIKNYSIIRGSPAIIKIERNGLPPGIYVVKVSDEDGNGVVEKVVLQ